MRSKATLIIILLSFVTATCGIFLVSNFVSADDSIIDDVAISVPISCTMMGTGTNTHNDEVPNGTYKANIGTTTLKVYCNDSSGFSIYAIGFTGEQYSGDNTKLIGVNSNQMISTGTAESGNTSNWAMKLATNSGATYPITLQNGYGAYSAVPATYTKVATRATATDVGNNATGAELTTTYASYMSSSQVADTYSGKVKYTLVHPANETPLQPQTTEAGCIRYYPNGSNIEGTMGCQPITSSATSATLLASNFSREGYGFAGWSTTFDYSDDTGFLGPQEYIEFPAGTYTGNNDGLSLYAHWIKSAGSLQGWTGCSSLQSGTVTALTDQRDNETYAIAKLADGNCWMIENLRLENTAAHNSDGTLAQGYGTSSTYGNFFGLADPESDSDSSAYSPTANSLYYSGTQSGTAYVNIGTGNLPGLRMPRYNNLNTPTNSNNRPNNPTTDTFPNDNTTVGMFSYGNYYTWHAAIADTTYYDSGDHGTTSLCPTGWRLPIGNQTTTNMSFSKLSVALGGPEGGAVANTSSTPTGAEMSNVFRRYPNNYLFSGNFSASSASSRGTGGGKYWSSTADSNINSYNLNLNSANAGINSGNKTGGYSIRCVVSGF